MRVKTVSVTLTRKINLGNYESADIQLGAVAELQRGENARKIRQQIKRELLAEINAEVEAINNTGKPKRVRQ